MCRGVENIFKYWALYTIYVVIVSVIRKKINLNQELLLYFNFWFGTFDLGLLHNCIPISVTSLPEWYMAHMYPSILNLSVSVLNYISIFSSSFLFSVFKLLIRPWFGESCLLLYLLILQNVFFHLKYDKYYPYR